MTTVFFESYTKVFTRPPPENAFLMTSYMINGCWKCKRRVSLVEDSCAIVPLLTTLSWLAQTLKYVFECVHSVDNLMLLMVCCDKKCQYVCRVRCIANPWDRFKLPIIMAFFH